MEEKEKLEYEKRIQEGNDILKKRDLELQEAIKKNEESRMQILKLAEAEKTLQELQKDKEALLEANKKAEREIAINKEINDRWAALMGNKNQYNPENKIIADVYKHALEEKNKVNK